MGITGNIHIDECLVYIFTGKVENGTAIIFNEALYNSWYESLRNNFHLYWLILHTKMHILNQFNGKLSSSGLFDPETINPHDLCYQCSK